MIDKTLAVGYLQALFELARAKNQFQQTVDDLGTVAGIFRENAQLRKVILHPSVTRGEKTRLVENIFAPHLSPLVRNFLLLIITKRREKILDDILEQYQAVADSVSGTCRAVVQTAMPLSDERLIRLKAALVAVTKKTVEVETRVTPEILGGVVVRIGNKVIDGSIVTRLNNLRRRLVETGVG